MKTTEKNHDMKYEIEQQFASLGDPATKHADAFADAKREAETLRKLVAAMVAEWETPETDPADETETGSPNEIACWREAQEIAGCTYDDDGDRTGPRVYGIDAGKFIAAQAVTITDENGEEVEA